MTVIAWTFFCGLSDKKRTSPLALLITLIWAILFDTLFIYGWIK